MAYVSLELKDKISGSLDKVKAGLVKVSAQEAAVAKVLIAQEKAAQAAINARLKAEHAMLKASAKTAQAEEKAVQQKIKAEDKYWNKLQKDIDKQIAQQQKLAKAEEKIANAKAKTSAKAITDSDAKIADMLGGAFKKIAEYGAAAAVAVGAMVFELGKMGIEAVQAREKAVASLGPGMVSMIDKLRDTIGKTREEIVPMAEKLKEAGITSIPAMQKALTALAATANDTQANALEKLLLKMNAVGEGNKPQKWTNALALAIDKTGASATRVKETLEKMPGGLKNGIVDAKKLADVIQDDLVKNSDMLKAKAGDIGAMWAIAKEKLADAAGKGLAPMIPLIQKMFVGFTKVLPYVHYGFSLALNKGVHAALYIKAHWDKIGPVVNLIGKGLIFMGEMFVAAVGVALVVGAALIATLGLIVAAVGKVADFFSAAFHLASSAVTHAWASIKGFAGNVATMVSDAVSALGNMASGAVTAAANFISGLVNGIKSGALAVINAVEGLGDSAVSALKTKLHIGSPSKVMMQMGKFTAEGFAGGIEHGGDAVHRASSGMASRAVGGASDGSSGGGGKSVNEFHFAPGAIVIQAPDATAQGLMAGLEEGVAIAFERVVAAQGL